MRAPAQLTCSSVLVLLHANAFSAFSVVSSHPRPTASSRGGAVVLAANPFAADCPLFKGCPFSNDEPSSAPGTNAPSAPAERASPLDTATQAADQLERALQSSLGTSQPFACAASEVAIETVLRAATDELGSCEVTVGSGSSARLLRGELDQAALKATGVSLAGLRLSSVELEATGVRLDPGSPLAARLPNLAAAATARFGFRLTQDDINRSPVLFSALEELLRELLRSGVSAAIGEALPRDSASLQVKLVRVEALEGGRIVLVADADSRQSDGTVLTLRGMRVRTTPRASVGERLILLDSPELVSSFEGFGARLELGLPFLRAAGVPLPEALSIQNLQVADGALQVDGSVRLEPIDYEDLARAADRLEEELRRGASQPVTVDIDATADEEPPDDGEGYAALRSAAE